MKLIVLLLCLSGAYPVIAQEFLGKSGQDIQRFITTKGGAPACSSDTLRLNCREEDERGRIFDVSYSFALKDGICTSYRKTVPLHEHWLGVLRELINQHEGEGLGDTFEAESEKLSFIYKFEDFRIKLIPETGKIGVLFYQNPE